MWQTLLVVSFSLLSAKALDHHRLLSNSFGVPFVNASYDFVIIGGGNAGLAIAARLAEHSLHVAVIEAGGFYDQDNGNGSVLANSGGQFTGLSPLIKAPLIDWDFLTVPQTELLDRQYRYSRGKALGGSTARHYQAYVRPTKGAFQKWADEVGDDSYTWDNVFPYFKRSVQVTPPDYSKRGREFRDVAFDASHYGDGPVKVSWPNYVEPFGAHTLSVYEALGFKERKDGFTGGDIIGYGYAPFTVNPQDATRISSYTSYLNQAMRTTDLKVYHHTLAKRILFSSDNVANGVEVETAGVKYTLFANKEVILSAGVFQSPQLLMVSGIGPRRILEPLGIDVLFDSPGVGQNLQDHILTSVAVPVTVETISRLLLEPDHYYRANEQFLVNATGPLSSAAGPWAWEKTPPGITAQTQEFLDAEFPADWPVMEHIPLQVCMTDNSGLKPDPFDGKYYGSMIAVLNTAMSRGNVSVSSADSADPPIINPNWLTHPVDQELMIIGLKRARQIAGGLDILDGEEYFPGVQYQTDEEILGVIRESLGIAYHASCTCKMGKPPGDPSGDGMAVVDTKGVVYGVRGLRVVDASIFPFLVPSHPQGTIYMLAEKIADDIIKGLQEGSKHERSAPEHNEL